jgi:AcrR family transcriptional regulator
LIEDTRQRILAAARSGFGQHGYQSTTTREIAALARVAEPTIFRHFGSKAALFEEAVVTPFTRFIDQQLDGWHVRRAGSIPIVDETRTFYQDLFDLFAEERSIVPALLAVYHDDVTPSVRHRLEECMRNVIVVLERRSFEESRSRGNVHYDIASLSRIMVAVAFAIATLPRLFDTLHLDRGRLIEEMARVTAYGAEFRGEPILRSPSDHNVLTGPTGWTPLIGDEHWNRVQKVLPPSPQQRRPGRPAASDRDILEGILHILTSGIPWAQLPQHRFHVSGVTCWRRHRQWTRSGDWDRILGELTERNAPPQLRELLNRGVGPDPFRPDA